MEFSNSVNKQGLVEDIDFLCGTNSSSYPLNDKVRNINQAYQDVVRLIWECCDTWQYDDSNATDIPKVLTTLASGTQEYAVPSTAQKIRRIEVKDVNGNWIKLQPIDYKELGVALPEFLKTDGLPIYYDLVGNYINLYPTPSSTYITEASGMAVYIDRNVSLFTSASTTGVPGFTPQFHRLISLQVALDFEKDPGQRNLFLVEKNQLTEGLKRFYNSREVETRTGIRPSNKRNRRTYE